MIVVEGAAFAQEKSTFKYISLLSIQPKIIKQYSLGYNKSNNNMGIAKPFLPANFYSKQLGFFCKQEIKMDKAAIIPFRFRLGRVEQCDWLEGKKR